MVTILRPLSISELLDRTFHLYRNHFLVFLGITAIPQIVVLVLQLAGSALMFESPILGALFTGLIAGLASFIAVEVSQAATVLAVSEIHLDRPANIGSAFSGAKESLGRVIGISIGVGLAVGVGFLLLVVPGVYLALIWSLAIPVTVLEGGGFGESTSRSKVLTKGSLGRIFVIFFLVVSLTIVVSLIIELPLGMLAALLGQHYLGGMTALVHAMQAVGNFLSTCLVGPLATIAITLIYYDERVRKEGFDLQLMMAALQPGSTLPGSEPPATAAAAPNS
jgi:hypothetical protein